MVTSESFMLPPSAGGKSDVKGRPWETRPALDIGFHSGYSTLKNDPGVIMPSCPGRSLSPIAAAVCCSWLL